MERFLASKGKRLIGWDEILEGGLPQNASVMSWRGTAGGIEAARQGHDVVMSPTTHCYFDFAQSDDPDEPGALGIIPLERVYSFEPVPDGLSAAEARHVLGGQGNVWTERMPDGNQGVYTIFVNSDDGSRLEVGGILAVDNDGIHGTRVRSGPFALRKGSHPLRVTYFNAGGSCGLSVEIEGPGLARRRLDTVTSAR